MCQLPGLSESAISQNQMSGEMISPIQYGRRGLRTLLVFYSKPITFDYGRLDCYTPKIDRSYNGSVTMTKLCQTCLVL